MKILLFGSSIIRKWNKFTLKKDNEVIINKGISGLHTKELLSDKVMKFLYLEPHPNYMVFYCGSNDIFSNVPLKNIIENLQKFLNTLSKTFINTRIIVLSLIKSPKVIELYKLHQIDYVNTIMRNFCKKYPNLVFLNVNPVLNDNKYFLKDGLHISSIGYKKINNKIIDVL